MEIFKKLGMSSEQRPEERKPLWQVYAELSALDIPGIVNSTLALPAQELQRFPSDSLVFFRIKLDTFAQVLPKVLSWQEEIKSLDWNANRNYLEKRIYESIPFSLRFPVKRQNLFGDQNRLFQEVFSRRMSDFVNRIFGAFVKGHLNRPFSLPDFVQSELEKELVFKERYEQEEYRLGHEEAKIIELAQDASYFIDKKDLESQKEKQLARLRQQEEPFFTLDEIERTRREFIFFKWGQRHPKAFKKYPLWYEMDKALSQKNPPSWLLEAAIDHPDIRIVEEAAKSPWLTESQRKKLEERMIS